LNAFAARVCPPGHVARWQQPERAVEKPPSDPWSAYRCITPNHLSRTSAIWHCASQVRRGREDIFAKRPTTEMRSMLGGTQKLPRHAALLFAAGLLAAGGAAPAGAADLGGNCCADLEERVSELEATTARKGNRRVSLTISGQVSTALMAWDDGRRNDVYVVDNSV